MEEEDAKKEIVKIAIPQVKEEGSDRDDCYEIDPIDFTRKLAIRSYDDDCYEIDAIDFTRKLVISTSDDDGVAIVSEKGHVALRDFPHPRHLCGNFPFSRTRHETYCMLLLCMRGGCSLLGVVGTKRSLQCLPEGIRQQASGILSLVKKWCKLMFIVPFP
ncbi:uncharacterized protein LOC110018438 isoform X1 [Phalaenopsis equestris]|uniref:uncharacterized protein LOC110018438 isoform X1 n=1 Tax=Phalaenopsis equestris TaxID=78828 RepID=UPI0009E37986|nr:uncharacterized protein LOC110018438 isoform X1 [Phalaenopsis equestris]